MTQEFLHSCKNELKNAKEAVTISSMGEITMQLEHTETLQLDYELPEYPEIDPRYRRAPRRESHLSRADQALAIKNALRYIHPDHHAQMAKEFAQELAEHGRIYGYRFRPAGARPAQGCREDGGSQNLRFRRAPALRSSPGSGRPERPPERSPHPVRGSAAFRAQRPRAATARS